MNKKVVSVLFVILFLSFIGIMDYPFISRMIQEREQSAVVMAYHDLSTGVSQVDKEELLAAARAYNHALASGLSAELSMPFTQTAAMDSTYQELLAMDEEGVMAVLKIPRINVTLPIYHSVSDETLELGAGHLEGSSLPVGGESTHTCLAAHRGLVTKKMFTDLDQLGAGDVFFIQVLGETLAYQVYETEVVTPETVEPLRIIPEKDLITLITCTPYGVNTHRIYVHGTRIAYERAEEVAGMEPTGLLKTYWWLILTVILLIWMYVLVCWYNRKE